MSDVTLEVSDHVAVLRLNAVERRNALTPAMAADVVAAVDEVDRRPDVGALVITGGPAFCAGGALGMLAAVYADPVATENFDAIDTVYRTFIRVGNAAPPTIAAVRGAAVGAGLNLALATDLRVVARDARLIAGFGRIGVHPGGGHFGLLARVAGREATAAATLFGEELSGQRAVDLGIAWTAVDDGAVEATAYDLAHRVAQDPALARMMTASFRRQANPPGLPWEVATELERAAQLWSFRRRADR
ncbi:enoyl-CoA hydratase-related protein [Dactylosporangium sp. NPDC050688]|uniref:enoyl-CoA hydratase-related protein n=1 Tax=Dactylosporangium sp. NPDC050688 TaxID=3157217 RepID=UPI0033D7EEB3